MSKLPVPVNTVYTARAIFTEEDKQALDIYASFEGFQVNNIKIRQICNEFTDATTTDIFTLPEKGGEEEFW